MVDLGKLAKTVKKVVDTKGDKIAAGVEKATDFVDKKTKGKYHDHLEKVDGMAQKLDKTTDRGTDEGPQAAAEPPSPPSPRTPPAPPTPPV